MSSPNSDDLLDPNFWSALGMTPIVIDPDDDSSVQQGAADIAQQITDFISKDKSQD